jgi:hypothetical protein
MDLRKFVDFYGTRNIGQDLIALGPATYQVYKNIGDQELARSLIATVFWRAFTSTEAFDRAIRFLNATPFLRAESRIVIVPRFDHQHSDLLVLNPRLPPDWQPKSIDLDSQVFPSSEVSIGAKIVQRGGINSLIDSFVDAVVLEAAAVAQHTFSMMIARLPRTERLHVPIKAMRVKDDKVSNTSTAGVIAESTVNPRKVGVTAAFHGLQTKTVYVNGLVGSVARADLITDSAFIELKIMPKVGQLNTNGVMNSMTPRARQNASFIGATSGSCSSTITGWDQEIPTPSSQRQALIYTTRDAQQGDSGAALITDDKWIVGFAFERTLPGQIPEYCSWMWANSVMNALEIRLKN